MNFFRVSSRIIFPFRQLLFAYILILTSQISIMRSEFAEAGQVCLLHLISLTALTDLLTQALNELTAHTRSQELFPAYAARITLQHAQLAHARGDLDRALKCYRVAGWVATNGNSSDTKDRERDEWVRVAARAGEVWLRVGLLRQAAVETAAHNRNRVIADGDGEVEIEAEDQMETGLEHEMEELRTLGAEVAEECEGLGGTLMAIGEVLRACIGKELLKAKYVIPLVHTFPDADNVRSNRQHLRRALDLATRAQDNHLRALVLALISSHYQHTARDHALTMLGTCEQLAAGLGAVKKADKAAAGGKTASVGHAQLRLWVGERLLELRRWAGDTVQAERQVETNARMREAVERWNEPRRAL